MSNPYCETLGIDVPRLESVKDHREARPFTLLLVALLERGGPMTLAEVAARFEAAGIARAEAALRSLKRCRPGRAPVYRDGDLYELDPHDAELGMWLFRLGLRAPRPRPPEVSALSPPPPPPCPEPETPLSIEELDEVLRGEGHAYWSAQRLVLAVLDAHGRALRPEEVVAFVDARSERNVIPHTELQFGRRGAAIVVLDDGRWAIAPAADLRPMRVAARERLEMQRKWTAERTSPEEVEAYRAAYERERAERQHALARLRRAVVRAFPAKAPVAMAIVDVDRHEIESFVGEDIERGKERLRDFDVVAAVGVRALIRTLGLDPGTWRLADLAPPQKTRQINRRGRTLRITLDLIVQGSCGIGRPFGDEKVMTRYIAEGKLGRLRRRVEADAKSLYALYQYSRLHRGVRLRWGFLDEMLAAPWVSRDEAGLTEIMERALESGAGLDVVAGTAPGWSDPWARAFRCEVGVRPGVYRDWPVLFDEDGFTVPEEEVQRVRFRLGVG